MKRGLIGTLGVAMAVAVLSVAVTTWDRVTAQEAEERERGPERLSIVAFGGGAYLGVQVSDVDEEYAAEVGLSDVRGVRIQEVVEDGPAADAGLREGDVVVSWSGTRLESLAQLQRHLRETPAGRTVQLGIYRDGREQQIGVELGERSSVGPTVFAEPRRLRTAPYAFRVEPGRTLRIEPGRMGRASMFFGGRGRMGVSVQSLSDQLADYFGVEGGALVTSVHEDTPAERAGLQAGDVIIEVAGERIEDPGDLVGMLSDQEPGPVSVRVVRDGQERSFTVELEERHSGVFCGDEDEDCEAWAEEWGQALGDWAEGLSDRWESWAEENRDVWEEWGTRWEKWGEELEDRWQEHPNVHIEGIHLPSLDLGPFLMDLPAIEIPEIHIPEIVVPHTDVSGSHAVIAASSREI